MSILDHSPSYQSPMDYQEHNSASISGKFFWFSGYYNIGFNEKPAYSESENEHAITDTPVVEDGLTEVGCSDSAEDIDDEINRSLELVNDLIAELTETEAELTETEAELTETEEVIEDSIDCVVDFALSNEPQDNDFSRPLNNKDPVNVITRHINNPEPLTNTTKPICNGIIHHGINNENTAKKTENIPFRTLWFRYEDDPIIDEVAIPEKPVSPFEFDSVALFPVETAENECIDADDELTPVNSEVGELLDELSLYADSEFPEEATLEDDLTLPCEMDFSGGTFFKLHLSPVCQASPAYDTSTVYHTSPAYDTSPVYHTSPVYRTSPVYHTSPAIEDVTHEAEQQDSKTDCIEELPNEINSSNITDFTDHKLLSSIDDLLDEVNGNSTPIDSEECLPEEEENTPAEMKEKVCYYTPCSETPLFESSDIPSLDADVENHSTLFPLTNEDIAVQSEAHLEECVEAITEQDVEDGIPLDLVCTNDSSEERRQGTLHVEVENIPSENNIVILDNIAEESSNTNIKNKGGSPKESCDAMNFAHGVYFQLQVVKPIHEDKVRDDHTVPIEESSGVLKEEIEENTEGLEEDILPVLTEDVVQNLEEEIPSEESPEETIVEAVRETLVEKGAEHIIVQLKETPLQQCNEDIIIQPLGEEPPSQKRVEEFEESPLEECEDTSVQIFEEENINIMGSNENKLRNEILAETSEDITLQKDIDTEFDELKDEYLKEDESFQAGTWFGFSGRTYRAKPMDNLLDIDTLDDVLPIDLSNDKIFDSTSSHDWNLDELPNSETEINQKISETSEISDVSLMSQDSIEYGSSFDYKLTVVTPLNSSVNTGLLKLCQESSIEDEVFVESRTEEAPIFSYADQVSSSLHNFLVSEDTCSLDDELLEEADPYDIHILSESVLGSDEVIKPPISYSNQIPEESTPYSNQVPEESVPYSNQLPEESVPYSNLVPEESIPYSNQVPEESVSYDNQVPEESIPYSNLVPEESVLDDNKILEECCATTEEAYWKSPVLPRDENTGKSELELSEMVVSKDDNQIKVFYNYQAKPVVDTSTSDCKATSEKDVTEASCEELEFINSYLTDSTKRSGHLLNDDLSELDSVRGDLFDSKEDLLIEDTENSESKENSLIEDTDYSLSKADSLTDVSVCQKNDFVDTSDDEARPPLDRGTSFRRSIVIEDEKVSSDHRRQSSGGTCVSAIYFTPASPQDECEKAPDNTICKQAKDLLNYLDNIIINEETFGKDFEVVKKLHALFWELKDNRKRNPDSNETLSSVLNYMVVQEWPKVFVGVLRKLKAAFPHVFQEHDTERVVYYSGHMPSILRMNRTSSEFAVAVIFDGLLISAINFTDVHEASRQASCEDDLISYLLEEIMPHLHSIHWGKATAKEMFLKSICDLIYNCSQSPSNASYMIDNELVNIFTMMRDEIADVIDARKVSMTMLLSLSYLIDDNNYDRIVPDESSILKLLQFLDKSLEHSEHTYLDFYSAELANCLSKLAAHHSNKVLITQNSGQEILHKLLKYAYDDDEKIAACDALWNIAFSREAKDILRGMGKLMTLLRELKKHDDSALGNAAAGVLWECEEKYDIKGVRNAVSMNANHIMISYEYETQPLVISIRDELEHLGFKVWMVCDEDNLEQIMTHGIEGASVVIAAVTRKYKQEPHTFAEVDYAHSLRKRIIPIVIDMDFTPDGWLNQHMQKEKTFDFSRRSMFNGSLDALIEYLKIITTENGDSRAISINITEGGASKDRSADVLSWTNGDVIDWLTENRLIRSGNNGGGRLQKLTGLHLLMFYDLKKESPDYYYSVLDSHLGFKDVLDTLEFTYTLDRLLGNERLI